MSGLNIGEAIMAQYLMIALLILCGGMPFCCLLALRPWRAREGE